MRRIVPILLPVDETAPPAERARALTDHFEGRSWGPVSWVAETGSTNADALAAAGEGADGLVCIADHQTAGRGRRDRSWVTRPGAALLMSVVRSASAHSADLPVGGAALGLAACMALHTLGFVDVAVKWPNDLVVGRAGDQAKLAGVLAQSTVRGPDASVVLGIGLNVRADGLDRLVPDRTTVSLAELGPAPDRVALAATILEHLLDTWPLPADFWDSYRSMSATLGTDVVVATDTGSVSGRAVDVDATGSLILETAEGPRIILVGDVESVRPAG